ncbi:hypothetical protein Tco_0729787 [Tanacetum coccineum]|uniref:Retrotransposon gag domain-containing protein n=1 Tax=Tanacetum coccineum TaxID=301880 RepID=A0ABQ4YSA1_9ASTR
MECETAERRLHKSRVWNNMFYLDMVRIGAVLKPPSNDEDTERPIMPPKAMFEARRREVFRDQVATSMAEFVANMNRGTSGAGAGGAGTGGAGAGGTGTGGVGAGGAEAGSAKVGCAGPTAPEITGCTFITFMECDPHPFKGTEGAVGLCQWFEKLKSVFRMSNCKERDKVKFATATLQGRALTWWNGMIASMGIDAANGTPWTEVRKLMTEEFCPRSVLQRLEQELYNLKLKGTDIDGLQTDSMNWPCCVLEWLSLSRSLKCAGDVVDFRTWPGISLETSMMSTMHLDGVTCLTVIMESLVKKKQKGAILELKRRHLKNTIFCTYTPYPAMKIRRISASSAQETRNDQFPIRRIHYNQYAVCTAVHQSKIRI